MVYYYKSTLKSEYCDFWNLKTFLKGERKMIGIFNVSTRIEDYKECKECGFLATDLENHPKECMTPDHLRRGVFFAKGSKGLKAKEKLELEDKKNIGGENLRDN